MDVPTTGSTLEYGFTKEDEEREIEKDLQSVFGGLSWNGEGERQCERKRR